MICALCHAAGKSAGALKTENAPNGPLIRPPHAWDEASVAPEIVRACRVASYQGAPFSRPLTSNHHPISNRRPLRFDTAIDSRFFRLPERLNAAIWRYMWCGYRLLVVLLRTYSYTSLLVSLVGRTIYFGCQLPPVGSPLVSAVCPPARRIYVAPYHSLRPGRPGLLWVPGSILERP